MTWRVALRLMHFILTFAICLLVVGLFVTDWRLQKILDSLGVQVTQLRCRVESMDRTIGLMLKSDKYSLEHQGEMQERLEALEYKFGFNEAEVGTMWVLDTGRAYPESIGGDRHDP